MYQKSRDKSHGTTKPQDRFHQDLRNYLFYGFVRDGTRKSRDKSHGTTKPQDRFHQDFEESLISRVCTGRDTEITGFAQISRDEFARDRDIKICTGRDRDNERLHGTS